MSLYKMLFSVGLVSFILAGCGFQPLYYRDGARSSIRAYLQSVNVLPIADRIGQELRNHLRDALSPTGLNEPVKWDLTVTLSESTQKISIESTNFSTRANLFMTASITLVDKVDAKNEAKQASMKTISSYNLVDSDYANLVAEQDARSRAVVDLSNDIRRQLALWLREDQE